MLELVVLVQQHAIKMRSRYKENYTKKKPQALFPVYAFTLNSTKLSSHTFVAEQILSAHFKSCVLHCEK